MACDKVREGTRRTEVVLSMFGISVLSDTRHRVLIESIELSIDIELGLRGAILPVAHDSRTSAKRALGDESEDEEGAMYGFPYLYRARPSTASV